LQALKQAYPQLPERIDTDVGVCTLGLVRSRSAEREYLCPLCDENIEVLEQHVVAVPLKVEALRRHVHGECLLLHLEHNLTIKLHPKEPDALKYPT
jgi:hypothetical protein